VGDDSGSYTLLVEHHRGDPCLRLPFAVGHLGLASSTATTIRGRTTMTRAVVMRSGIATALLILVLVAGCGHQSPLGPPHTHRRNDSRRT
jgi:hypothetical protein